MKIKFDESKTKKNLETAFAGESMANRKYLYFAKLARELGDNEVADLFEKTAAQETEHAFSHLNLIYPKEQMTVEKILELAIEGERYEHQIMYPAFEQTALEEGELLAQEHFGEHKEESFIHETQFLKTLELAKKRFLALTIVEKKHADQYENLLKQKRSR